MRQIDHGQYSAKQFVDELKQMVNDIVREVLSDNSQRRVSVSPTAQQQSLPPVLEKARAAQSTEPVQPKRKIIRVGSPCPVCGEGKVIKGNTAYGCSRWREGCTFRKPFKK